VQRTAGYAGVTHRYEAKAQELSVAGSALGDGLGTACAHRLRVGPFQPELISTARSVPWDSNMFADQDDAPTEPAYRPTQIAPTAPAVPTGAVV
jgi:hypothetical protein